MRTLDHFNRLIDDGKLGGRKRLLVHSIEAEDLIRGISWWSRLNADWDFLTHLRDLASKQPGREQHHSRDRVPKLR
jgi:NTE family protein